MYRKVDHKIIPAKKKLRKLSKDFKQNFKNIENYIKKEIYKIKRLKKLSKNIIPEIKYKELFSSNLRIIDQIKKRGGRCFFWFYCSREKTIKSKK